MAVHINPLRCGISFSSDLDSDISFRFCFHFSFHSSTPPPCIRGLSVHDGCQTVEESKFSFSFRVAISCLEKPNRMVGWGGLCDIPWTHYLIDPNHFLRFPASSLSILFSCQFFSSFYFSFPSGNQHRRFFFWTNHQIKGDVHIEPRNRSQGARELLSWRNESLSPIYCSSIYFGPNKFDWHIKREII